MALREASSFSRAGVWQAIDSNRNGVTLQRPAVEAKNCSSRTRGGEMIAAATRRRSSGFPSAKVTPSFPLQQVRNSVFAASVKISVGTRFVKKSGGFAQERSAVVEKNRLRRPAAGLVVPGSEIRSLPFSGPFPLLQWKTRSVESWWHTCHSLKNGNKEGDDESYDENGFNKFGFDRTGRDKFGRDKEGLDKEGLDKFLIPGDAVVIGPIDEPAYNTYTDPLTGDLGPTFGERTLLPNAAFWGNDLKEIQRAALNPRSSSRSRSTGSPSPNEVSQDDKRLSSDAPPPRTIKAGRRRAKGSSSGANGDGESAKLSKEEIANTAELEIRGEEDGEKYKSLTAVMKDSEGEEEKAEISPPKSVEEEEEDQTLGDIFRVPGYPLVRNGSEDGKIEKPPLTNDELWWNWQKPAENEKLWSAWQKRPGDADTVMASAMAETGQIKLFGEKPTIAEATLARARRYVFYEERMAQEEARKQEIGALAYYKEWVKAYKGHTSKEDVQKHYERTGEEEGIQLMNMLSYQTLEEYRKMQGTDVRIRRDPLVMRMRPEQIKQVWGGDPVYPTINYEQDPNSYADYRNENMHEPIPDILELLRESGRLKTQEEIKAILEQEKIEDDELLEIDEMSEAVDIGENVEDDDDDDVEDDEFEVDIEMQAPRNSKASKKRSPTEKNNFGPDDVKSQVTDLTILGDEDEDDE